MSGAPDAGAGRNRELAVIHIAANELGLDETVYREILRRVTGQSSAARLDERQRRAVIKEFERLGWKGRGRGQGRRQEVEGREGERPQALLIRSLWAGLDELGALRDPSDRGLDKFAKRVAGVEAVAWLDPRQANKVIEALKSWLGRAKGKAARENGR